MHTQTSTTQQRKQDDPELCGFCGAASLIEIDGRRLDRFCLGTKGGCDRITRPQPTGEKEKAEFDRWVGWEKEAAKYIGGFDVGTGTRERVEFFEDAVYFVRQQENGGRLKIPVLAQPFELEQIVLIDDEERLDVRAPGQISGGHDEVVRELRRTGRFLDPRHGERMISLLAHDYRSSRTVHRGQETIEVFQDPDYDRLNLMWDCYPQPGTQKEEYDQIKEIWSKEPTKKIWETYRQFEEHYFPKETATAKAAAALAPLARLLRSKRMIVASPYLISTNSGAGKTTVAETYSNRVWNQKERQAQDLNSDFRFADYLSSSATPMAVNEAEKFDWQKYGANIKASLESDTVTTRGTIALRQKKFPSRRIPIWTSNQLPTLPRPTLARLKVVRFNEERAKLDPASQREFQLTLKGLGPVGPALAQAWIRRFRHVDELLGLIEERAEEILKAHGPFEDLRRARCWALDHIALEIWENASKGVHEAPTVHEFVRDVVRPVELDTFSNRADRLAMFRAWFDHYRAEKRRSDGATSWVQGEGEIFAEHAWKPPDHKEHRTGWLVTSGLLQAYNHHTRNASEKIETLVEMARLVAEAYNLPSDALTEGRKVPRWRLNDTRQRAAWLPIDEPEDWQNE